MRILYQTKCGSANCPDLNVFSGFCEIYRQTISNALMVYGSGLDTPPRVDNDIHGIQIK